jgi:hypothetical protein
MIISNSMMFLKATSQLGGHKEKTKRAPSISLHFVVDFFFFFPLIERGK